MSCGFVLTLTGYSELVEEQKKKEDKLAVMEDKFNTMQSQMQALITTLSSLNDQSQLNQLAQIMFKSGVLKSPDLSKTIHR
jgi:acetamidase/formamidase